MPINFFGMHGRAGKAAGIWNRRQALAAGTGDRRWRGRAFGDGISGWSFQSDFTNKMGNVTEPAGSKAKGILAFAF